MRNKEIFRRDLSLYKDKITMLLNIKLQLNINQITKININKFCLQGKKSWPRSNAQLNLKKMYLLSKKIIITYFIFFGPSQPMDIYLGPKGTLCFYCRFLNYFGAVCHCSIHVSRFWQIQRLWFDPCTIIPANGYDLILVNIIVGAFPSRVEEY